MSVVAVFSRPGRDELTARTIALLDGNGGGSHVQCPKVLWWVGERSPPVVPSGWVARWIARQPAGSVYDFFELVRAAGAGDLHVFEDDVIPCRNLVPYLLHRPLHYFTTYFNPLQRPSGQAQLLTDPCGTTRSPTHTGFDCSQAISIPGRLVDRFAALTEAELCEERLDNLKVYLCGQDILMHRCLNRWGEPCVWGPSLVQHVNGPRADGQLRSRWLNDPAFVGEDFDALTIVDDPPVDLLPAPPVPAPAPILRARMGDPRYRR